MKFKEVIIEFNAENVILAEELISEIFFSFNLKGVVCDVPLDEPDEGFGTNTLLKPAVNSITGFLPLIDSSKIIFEKISKKALHLTKFDIHVNIKTKIVDEKDWSEAWKAYFEVTKITDKITIKPTWKEYTAKANEIVIELDPGMAFGTGTHPTTYMCIELIEKYIEPGVNFLDIGTGSGILMIAAAKLGAKNIIGIDNDEVAIRVAQKNLDTNHIDPGLFNLACTTLEKKDDTRVSKAFGQVKTNIIAQVIVDIMPEISKKMTENTITILSGIIKERQKQVITALEMHNLDIIHEEYVDEWVALAVKRTI